MGKKKNKVKGNYGENLACKHLENEDYKIIEKNFNCSYGEIDIIAIKNNEIIFVEVKTRCQNFFGEPIESINTTKKYHIYNSAKYFLHKHNLLNASVRFDIIEVYLKDNKHFCYNLSHIQNVILDEPLKTRRKL